MKKLKDYLSKKTELTIGIAALLGWLLFAAAGKFLGWATYPAAYFQKIAFGVLGMSIITAVAWVWLGATFPQLKKMIDPDTANFKEQPEWTKIKMALSLFALYAFGAALLASLY